MAPRWWPRYPFPLEQALLLPARGVRTGDRDRGHVDDAPHRGGRRQDVHRARRILAAEGRSTEPKLEADSSATLGVRPKRLTSSAASKVISATFSASGSAVT